PCTILHEYWRCACDCHLRFAPWLDLLAAYTTVSAFKKEEDFKMAQPDDDHCRAMAIQFDRGGSTFCTTLGSNVYLHSPGRMSFKKNIYLQLPRIFCLCFALCKSLLALGRRVS